MNDDDSIFVELTNFDAKKQKALEELVKLTWSSDKQKSLGKFEEIIHKIKAKYKLSST